MVRRVAEILFVISVGVTLFAVPLSETIARRSLFVVCVCALALFNRRSLVSTRVWVLVVAAVTIAVIAGSVACSLGGFRADSWQFLRRYIYPVILFTVLVNVEFKHVGEKTAAVGMALSIVLGLIVAIPEAVRTSLASAEPLYLLGIPAINHSAAYVCMAMAALLVLASGATVRPLALLSYALSILLVLIGFLTRSRSFIFGAFFVLGAHLLFVRRDRRMLRDTWLAAAGMLVALTVASFAFKSSTSRMLSDLVADFFHGRLQIWEDATTLFSRYPACGIGLGRFRDPTFNPVYLERGAGEIYHHSHNIFLNALAEGGILLFAAVSVVVCSGFIFGVRASRESPQSRLVWLSTVSFGLFILFGLIDDTVVPALTFVPAIGFALILSFRTSGPTGWKS